MQKLKQITYLNSYLFSILLCLIFLQTYAFSQAFSALPDNSLKAFIPIPGELINIQDGKASWYGGKFHNRQTASGEIYDMNEYTAAHKNLPFGTIARVKNIQNNKSIILRITDRGPFKNQRIIDLSFKCAEAIESMGIGDVLVDCILPDVKIPVPHTNDRYFISYSYNFPFALISDIAVEFICYTHDFNIAMEYYHYYEKRNPMAHVFLMVPLDQRINRDNKNNKYYIGAVISTSPPQKLIISNNLR